MILIAVAICLTFLWGVVVGVWLSDCEIVDAFEHDPDTMTDWNSDPFKEMQ